MPESIGTTQKVQIDVKKYEEMKIYALLPIDCRFHWLITV